MDFTSYQKHFVNRYMLYIQIIYTIYNYIYIYKYILQYIQIYTDRYILVGTAKMKGAGVNPAWGAGGFLWLVRVLNP